jgi:hypothetical protein
MINLRWVERKKHFLDGKPIDMRGAKAGEIIECENPASFRTEIERVLQYRFQFGIQPKKWSEWQDTLVVSEES